MSLSRASLKRAASITALVLLGVAAGAVGTFYLLLGFNPPTINQARPGDAASPSQAQTVSIADVPKHVVQSFVAIEDERFYEHSGIDLWSVARAAFANSKGRRQGASTITMQVARNVVLADHSRTLRRKIREMFVALQLEHNYSKEQILECYLNEIFFGARAYGIQQASLAYFNKDAKDLSIQQAALLAGLVKAPSDLSPFKNADKALERRNVVLAKMWKLGYIKSNADYEQLLNTPIELKPPIGASDHETTRV